MTDVEWLFSPRAVVQSVNLVVGDGGAVIQEVSRIAYDYFSRLSGVTRYGTRVPLEVKQ
jgi:hypothetical protein